MSQVLPPAPAAPQPARERAAAWFAQHPAWGAVVLLGILFGIHLYTNRYHENRYDAQGYWELANKYWSTGGFELLSFDNILRGYLFPLIISPFTLLTAYFGWKPINITRGFGLGTAVLLFGVVGPGLWRALRGPLAPAVPLGRRLVFGLLGFLMWRDYFNFALTDFPALLALLAGIWALLRHRQLVWGGLLAGMAVGAALNFRPVYAATLPLVLLLSVWPRERPTTGGRWLGALHWVRGGTFLLGVALVLAPQLLINRAHFDSNSPLVLTAPPDSPNLYLSQVHGGLFIQKYETTVGVDYPTPSVVFRDATGDALATEAQLPPDMSFADYLAMAGHYPGPLLALWLRHLFNGLDLQYPTPYPQAIFVNTSALALTNYLVLITGILVLVRLGWRRLTWSRGPAIIVLLILLGPCAATLPVVMECRFLMPLHLLLCAMVAFGAHPLRQWRAASLGRRAAGFALYGLLVVGSFAVSASTQRQLEAKPRLLFKWQEPVPGSW
ncbi:hypothetical protein [Hymenobacter siberiensis]|uniref:hypothetical protein n=1 Tax=Hymenobacter siberiensis TaxID=2848396 RepID=UPI001C1E43DA|nr:hypothetical protein [Hymenobacter siberiensis]